MSNFFKQPRSHRLTNNWGVGDLALPLAGCGVVGQASLPHLQSENSNLIERLNEIMYVKHLTLGEHKPKIKF